jgi:hypothetical protein
MLKKIISLVINLLSFVTGKPNHPYIEVITQNDLNAALKLIHPNSTIFIDVDDTIITPKSVVFHAQSTYKDLIEDLKFKTPKTETSELLISRWRLQRKSMLIFNEWPSIIDELKQKGLHVYGLTKMDTGQFGDIASMEEWRYNELHNHGVTFTYHESPDETLFEELSDLLIEHNNPSEDPNHQPTFYKGIFFTGYLDKGRVIKIIADLLKFQQVVFIDDRISYLNDVYEACKEHNIPFLGIYFKGLETIDGKPDPKVAEFQKQYLFENHTWLEDDTAVKLMRDMEKNN